MKSTRDYSNIQENQIAKKVDGKVQSNSGGTKFGGGDVHTAYCLIEAKTPTKEKKSFSINKEWITKAKEQAFEQGKEEGIVAFRFNPDENKDYYILDDKQFYEYLQLRER